jgi:hypothetical protein
VPPLIEMKTKGKKSILAYNKSCETSYMKHHVEVLHLKLLPSYVVEHFVHDNVIGSLVRKDEGGKLMQPIEKCIKIVARVISSLFGNKTFYKRHDEVQKLLLKDLMLLTAKGHLPLSTCENV